MHSVLADRYSRAIFELALESKHQDRLFNELRSLDEILFNDSTIHDFLLSPLVKVEEKEAALEKALAQASILPETKAFVLLLAHKNRLGLFHEIVQTLQVQSDENHGLVRGNVRSAAVLGPEDRKRIEEIVSRYTNKQVLLTYKEDPQLIGGLIADVGSHTFDDSIASHLRRLKDEITRRTN